jgi:hypothetical protein
LTEYPGKTVHGFNIRYIRTFRGEQRNERLKKGKTYSDYAGRQEKST